MTAHELARKLLEMPDIVVACEDGADPSDLCEVTVARKEHDQIYLVGDRHYRVTIDYIRLS